MMNEFADIGRTWIVENGTRVIGALPLLLVAWVISAWVSAVEQDGSRAVKLTLDAAGIGFPFPQMDVHMDKP